MKEFPTKSQIFIVLSAIFLISVLCFAEGNTIYVRLIIMFMMIVFLPYLFASTVSGILYFFLKPKIKKIFYRSLIFSNIFVGIIVFLFGTYGFFIETNDSTKHKLASSMVPKGAYLSVRIKNWKNTQFCDETSPDKDVKIYPIFQKRTDRGFIVGTEIINCTDSNLKVADDTIVSNFYIERLSTTREWEVFWDLSNYIFCDKRSWDILPKTSWVIEGFVDIESKEVSTYRLVLTTGETGTLYSQKFTGNIVLPDKFNNMNDNLSSIQCVECIDNNNNKTSFVRRGMNLQKKGKYIEAIYEFSKAIRKNTKKDMAYNLRAMSWAEMKDYDKAISDYTEALKINPLDGETYSLRGIALSNIGEYQQAISDFDETIKIDSKNGMAYSCKCSALIMLKQYEQACFDCDKACELYNCDNIKLLKKNGYCQ